MAKRTVIAERYELTRPIAHGGMGEVWAGRDTKLDRKVAVKFIRYADGIPDSDFKRRFVRESRITARLQHPGVPAIYDVGAHDGRPYLVMQYIEGIGLDDLIAEHGPLPIGWATAIAAQICAVLAVAHGASLIHRDLKPSNVMLERDGGIKVLDFGLAAAPALPEFSKITKSGEPIGTPAYMAPEQVVAGISGPRTDLYALGCTVHEMLAGRALFNAPTSYAVMSMQVEEPPPPLRTLRPDVPEELEELVLHLLEKKPEDRPAGADVTYERLLPFAVSLNPLPAALDPPSKPSPVRMYARVLSRIFVGEPSAGVPASPQPTTGGKPVSPEPFPRQKLSDARHEAANLAKQSRFSQAAEVLASTVERAIRALGATDRDVLDVRLELANLRFEGGDYRGAAPEYRDLAADLTAKHGHDHDLVLHCRLREATCHALAGETSKALSELDDLLTHERRVFGPDDPRTIDLRRQIALLQLGSGRRDAAADTLRQLLADLNRLHGPAHATVVEIKDLLSRLDTAESRRT